MCILPGGLFEIKRPRSCDLKKEFDRYHAVKLFFSDRLCCFTPYLFYEIMCFLLSRTSARSISSGVVTLILE